ncbi:MAG: CsiV family protein [Methylococcales bacterium]
MTMTYRKIIIFVCLFMTLLPTLTHAEKRKFQIDVLVFKQNSDTSEEMLTSYPPLKWPKKMIEPGEKTTKVISTSSSKLAEAAAMLARKPQYSILAHQSLEQVISSEKAGNYVHIKGNGANGFVRLKRGHNLHLNIGMEYPNESTENTFVISEKRRVLLNKKHYFDHPRIGVITHVSPL